MSFRVASRSLTLAVVCGLAACSGGRRELRQDELSAVQHGRAARVRPTAARPLLDLPAALHLPPAGFSALFGPPGPQSPGFADPGKFSVTGTAPSDSLAVFRVQELTMLVTFSRPTGVVQDVLLLGADEAALMRQASLLPDAPGYLLLSVFKPRHADQLFGLRVVPQGD